MIKLKISNTLKLKKIHNRIMFKMYKRQALKTLTIKLKKRQKNKNKPLKKMQKLQKI